MLVLTPLYSTKISASLTPTMPKIYPSNGPNHYSRSVYNSFISRKDILPLALPKSFGTSVSLGLNLHGKWKVETVRRRREGCWARCVFLKQLVTHLMMESKLYIILQAASIIQWKAQPAFVGISPTNNLWTPITNPSQTLYSKEACQQVLLLGVWEQIGWCAQQ